ncbi:MAG: hypothetical protein DMF94_15800 [Acidobacteria bacterium]|nr:MAG: hypothetical protein DMF94_15800 [Acidobacteriota bacterium]
MSASAVTQRLRHGITPSAVTQRLRHGITPLRHRYTETPRHRDDTQRGPLLSLAGFPHRSGCVAAFAAPAEPA